MITYNEFCEICEKYGLDIFSLDNFNRTYGTIVSHDDFFVVADYEDGKGVLSWRDGNLMTEKETVECAIKNFLKWLKESEKKTRKNEIRSVGKRYEV